MSPSKSQVRTCAKNMVDSCNLSRGDSVIVKSGAHNQELLEHIALECYRRGAVPIILTSSDRLAKAVYDEISASTLSTVPKHYVGMVRDADMLIAVEEIDDPKVAEGFPRDKLTAKQRGMLPVYDLIYDPKDGKKWLYAGWPTEAAAKSYGIPYKQLERIIVGGISVPSKELMRTGMKMLSKFKDASDVHVWDGKGTDFRVNVRGRRANIDDGFISKDDFKAGDRGCNLPAGELFFAPHETVGEGTIYCPITRDRMSEKLIRDVRLEFKDGRLLLNKTEAANDVDQLVASFKECERIDRKKYDPVRTKNVAELGIGFNPKIKRAIGYILTDEKVWGTVHVAFGSNNTYGGESESIMHWDFVSAPGINIEVERDGGKTTRVMTKGKLV